MFSAFLSATLYTWWEWSQESDSHIWDSGIVLTYFLSLKSVLMSSKMENKIIICGWFGLPYQPNKTRVFCFLPNTLASCLTFFPFCLCQIALLEPKLESALFYNSQSACINVWLFNGTRKTDTKQDKGLFFLTYNSRFE